MPNEIFNLGLRAGEIALYAFLLKCEDRKTFKCWPSYKIICKAQINNFIMRYNANQRKIEAGIIIKT